MISIERGAFLEEDTASVDTLIRRGLEESGLQMDEEWIVRDLSLYASELERWNRKINLTGKSTVKEVVTDLLYDAFFVYPHIKDKRSILDMGSGAGVIGITFAILDCRLQVVSVDANTKKIQFQRHVKRTLRLDNLAPFACRIEDLEPQKVDIVVVKAFGSAEDALNKSGKHLCREGSVVLMKGKSEPEKDFPGFSLKGAIRYHLPGSIKEFKLLIYKKVP